MAHNILITGASGYLGGTLLARWKEAGLNDYDKLFALVRTDAQAEAVKSYGAEPLSFSLKDEIAVRDAVVNNRITILYYLIDALNSAGQKNFIKALAEVKRLKGGEVHFLHVSGADSRFQNAGTLTIVLQDLRRQDFLEPRWSIHRSPVARYRPRFVQYSKDTKGAYSYHANGSNRLIMMFHV